MQDNNLSFKHEMRKRDLPLNLKEQKEILWKRDLGLNGEMQKMT
jgi:hypothetical protein